MKDKDAVINDARNDKNAGRLLYKKYLPLTLFVRFERVVQGLHVRGSWRPNITEIFWPRSYGRQRWVFLVLYGCSTGAMESTLLGAGFPYYISSTSHLSTTRLSLTQLNRPQLNSSALYYLQTPTRWYGHASTAIGMCHFHFLWNGLGDRHRVEITVMQFRGHSLPVRQSMRV